MKSILSIFLCFIIINTSVAKSDENQVLKITRFSPSNLAAYLSTNTAVEKRIYNTHNDYEVKYDVVYQSKPITLTIQSSHPLDLADFQGTSHKTVKLTNISNNAEIKKWECNDKICSYAIFSSDDISGEGYSTTISYALPMHDVHIGEDFMKSLFIEETNCHI